MLDYKDPPWPKEFRISPRVNGKPFKGLGQNEKITDLLFFQRLKEVLITQNKVKKFVREVVRCWWQMLRGWSNAQESGTKEEANKNNSFKVTKRDEGSKME